MMLESIPYLSVGLDVGADFTWMSIMLPNGILTGKPSVVRQALGKSMLLPSTMLYAQLQKMPLFSDVCFLAMHSVSRIRLYIKTYREYHAHLDSILKELHKAVDKLEGTSDYDRISLVQPLHGVGFLSAVVLIAEMGSFDQFSPPKKLYTYFGLDPAVKQSGNKVHMSKRSSCLAMRILHMVSLNNLKVDKGSKTPANSVIHSYYADKCKSKQKTLLLVLSCIKFVTSFIPCFEIINRLSSHSSGTL